MINYPLQLPQCCPQCCLGLVFQTGQHICPAADEGTHQLTCPVEQPNNKPTKCGHYWRRFGPVIKHVSADVHPHLQKGKMTVGKSEKNHEICRSLAGGTFWQIPLPNLDTKQETGIEVSQKVGFSHRDRKSLWLLRLNAGGSRVKPIFRGLYFFSL